MTESPGAQGVAAVRALGQAAFLTDPGIEVLDLVHDSVLDEPEGSSDPVRRLRFSGRDCTVELDVVGWRRLTVKLRITPSGPVVVETRTPGPGGPQTIVCSLGEAVLPVRSELTTFMLHWPDGTRPPARTAWTPL